MILSHAKNRAVARRVFPIELVACLEDGRKSKVVMWRKVARESHQLRPKNKPTPQAFSHFASLDLRAHNFRKSTSYAQANAA